MRMLILRDTVANGAAVLAGQVCDLPDADAAMLLRLGKAVRAPDVSGPVPVVNGKPATKRAR
jgi:hypothetical protein